jgi:hypothetical protein
VCRGDPDTGDLIEAFHRLTERDDQLLDPGLDRGDIGAGLINPGQHRAEQERVVVAEPPDERLLQPWDLGPHPSSGERGEDLRITLPGQQRGHHLPP